MRQGAEDLVKDSQLHNPDSLKNKNLRIQPQLLKKLATNLSKTYCAQLT